MISYDRVCLCLCILWSGEVEETSVTLTDLQSTSASRRKIVLLSPQRDVSATASTSDCADDNFILLHMDKLQDIVKPLTCPRCSEADLHVTSTDTKGYAVHLLLVCGHCDVKPSSEYSSPQLPTSDNPT